MTQLILHCPHTHVGRLHAPGETLDVDAPTADWLIDQGVAQPEPEALPVVDLTPDPKPSTRKDPKP